MGQRSMERISDEEYDVLFTFRSALRQFLRWSDEASARVGLTSQQHQLLLAVRAHRGDAGPSIGEVASYLLIRHHSAVELVRRVELMGMIARETDTHDQRVVRLRLTDEGHRVLDQLTNDHMAELERAASTLHISEDFLLRLSEDFLDKVPRQDA